MVLAGFPSTGLGQRVRLVIVDRGDAPIRGVVAQLVDSVGGVAARALSDERGELVLATPAAGVYRIRTLRIGFRPVLSEPLDLATRADLTRRVVLAAIPLSLDTVRVDGRRLCRSRAADSAAIVFQAWEQVRAALTATELTGSNDLVTTVVGFERTLDPAGAGIRAQHATVQSGHVRSPWLAQAPDQLRRDGYIVQSAADSVTFYAPGLDMLSSTEFIEDHCLRIGNDRDATLLAIQFEPTSARRRVPEIKGTMWLDRATSELRRLAFSYMNVPSALERFAGGEMGFTRLRTGGWVISRWSIQMPVFALTSVPSLGRGLGRRETEVAELRIAGGVLSTVLSAGDTVWSRPPVTLTGRVIDSVSRDPVVHARVALRGTPLSGMTDDRGQFSIDGLLPGDYTLEVRTPGLDSLNAVQTIPVVIADTAAPIQIRALSPRQFEIGLCGPRRLEEPGIVTGRIRIALGDSLPPNTRVSATWSVLSVKQGAPGQNFVTTELRSRDARAGADGTFKLCGVPVNTALSITAAALGAESPEPTSITIPPYTRYAQADVPIARVAEGRASFSGTVLIDSTMQAIAGAEVILPELGRAAVTSESGTFRMVEVPAGTHRVVVRRLGFAPVETELTFASGQRVVRTIYLARMTVLDSVRVMAAAPIDRLMESFEEHRHVGLGHFLTSAQLRKMEGRTTGAVLTEFPGMTFARGHSTQAWVVSSRGPSAHATNAEDRAVGAPAAACFAQVYLDRMRVYSGRPREPLFDVNSIAPEQIEAIEYYAGPAETPAEYSGLESTCGVLVIWTRRSW